MWFGDEGGLKPPEEPNPREGRGGVRLSWSSITLLSFDLWRNYYVKNVVLFEENSILLLPECLESSGW